MKNLFRIFLAAICFHGLLLNSEQACAANELSAVATDVLSVQQPNRRTVKVNPPIRHISQRNFAPVGRNTHLSASTMLKLKSVVGDYGCAQCCMQMIIKQQNELAPRKSFFCLESRVLQAVENDGRHAVGLTSLSQKSDLEVYLGRHVRMVDGPISWDQLKASIDVNYPISVSVKWDLGGSHSMIISGYEESFDASIRLIVLNDPERGGEVLVDYKLFVNGCYDCEVHPDKLKNPSSGLSRTGSWVYTRLLSSEQFGAYTALPSSTKATVPVRLMTAWDDDDEKSDDLPPPTQSRVQTQNWDDEDDDDSGALLSWEDRFTEDQVATALTEQQSQNSDPVGVNRAQGQQPSDNQLAAASDKSADAVGASTDANESPFLAGNFHDREQWFVSAGGKQELGPFHEGQDEVFDEDEAPRLLRLIRTAIKAAENRHADPDEIDSLRHLERLVSGKEPLRERYVETMQEYDPKLESKPEGLGHVPFVGSLLVGAFSFLISRGGVYQADMSIADHGKWHQILFDGALIGF